MVLLSKGKKDPFQSCALMPKIYHQLDRNVASLALDDCLSSYIEKYVIESVVW